MSEQLEETTSRIILLKKNLLPFENQNKINEIKDSTEAIISRNEIIESSSKAFEQSCYDSQQESK